MSFKVKFRGLEVVCETAEDVLSLSMVAERNTKRKPAADTSNGKHEEKLDKSELVRKVLLFLRAVHRAGNDPIGGPPLFSAINVKRTGFGTIVAMSRRELKDVGFALEDAVIKVRVGDNKFWKSGPRIKDAIEKLEGVL